MTELNKNGVIGLLHLHKGIRPSHMAPFPFQKCMYVSKNTLFVQQRKIHTLILKMMIKNICCFFCTKTQYSFTFDYRGVGKRCEGGGEGGLMESRENY